jgi:hypothetical protein
MVPHDAGPPGAGPPGLRVEDPALAYRVLDVAPAVARRLDRRADAVRVAQAIYRPPLYG